MALETLTAASSSWDDMVGPWFVVPAGSDSAVHVILPALVPEVDLDTIQFDLTSLQQQHLQLFNHGKAAGEADVAFSSTDSTADCPMWPVVTVRTNTRAWNVGFQPGRVRVFLQDTLAGLNSGDSARLVIEAARLASAVPGDTSGSFRGRPFVVRQAVRATVEEHAVLIAEVVRTVNQEATPLQEHLLIVAERTGDTTGWSTVHAERSIATEEQAETTDVLAIFRPIGRSEGLFVLLSRDFGEGGAFALLERTPSGTWHVRWTSPIAGC